MFCKEETKSMRIIILLFFIVCTSHIAAAQDKKRKIVTSRIEDAWAKSKTTESLNLIILNCDKRGSLSKISWQDNKTGVLSRMKQAKC
jgi:hypothetical protein